jgi:hypothetical protein
LEVKFDFDPYIELGRSLGIQEKTVRGIVSRYKEILEKANKQTLEIDDWIRDRRSPEKFVGDLLDAWITEDLELEWIGKKFEEVDPKCVVKGSGSDKDRVIQMGQRPKRVTTHPDFHVDLSDGRHTTIEFQFSNKDRSTYDIKDSKVDRADKQETSFVFLVKPSRKYFVLTPQEVKKFGVLRPNPLWGGKPCYNIPKEKLTIRGIDDPLDLDDFF